MRSLRQLAQLAGSFGGRLHGVFDEGPKAPLLQDVHGGGGGAAGRRHLAPQLGGAQSGLGEEVAGASSGLVDQDLGVVPRDPLPDRPPRVRLGAVAAGGLAAASPRGYGAGGGA